MTSASSAIRRRAVLLLAGTAIVVLGSAAPAFAEPTPPPKPKPTPTRTVPPPHHEPELIPGKLEMPN